MLGEHWAQRMTLKQRQAVNKPAAVVPAVHGEPDDRWRITAIEPLIDATTEIALIPCAVRLLADLEARGITLQVLPDCMLQPVGGPVTEEERKQAMTLRQIIVKLIRKRSTRDDREQQAANCQRQREQRAAWRTVIEGNEFTGLAGEGI